MKSFVALVVAAAGLLDLTTASPSSHHTHLQARQKGHYATMTLKGCYSSNGGATLNRTSLFNTDGECQQPCVDMGKPIMLLGAGNQCWCGDLLPNSATKLDDSKCNVPCPGSAASKTLRCGGLKNAWNVYNDALFAVDPEEAPAPSSSSTSTPTPTPSSTAGNAPAATTIVTTAPATSSEAANKSKKSGPNVAAIAAGVVVGIVLIAAIAGGVFIYMRNQKRREIEEEHRRNAATSSFAAGGKPPLSAGSSFTTDTRLDPVVMARRESTGSIADNQDYSRRILKVTNA